MSKLIPYNHPDLGTIHVLMLGDTFYAVGKGIAAALNYTFPTLAVLRHCFESEKYIVSDSRGRPKRVKLIKKNDIRRLIELARQSHKKGICSKAQGLEFWLFDQVIPAVERRSPYHEFHGYREDSFRPSDSSLTIRQAFQDHQKSIEALRFKEAFKSFLSRKE